MDTDFCFGRRKSDSSDGGGSSTEITALGVIADGLLGSVSAGYIIETIVILEVGGGVAEINLGSAALGVDIVPSQPIPANSNTVNNIGYNPNADLTGFDIYISNNFAWGATELDIYIILRKIF